VEAEVITATRALAAGNHPLNAGLGDGASHPLTEGVARRRPARD
jgi:hypothetical protein